MDDIALPGDPCRVPECRLAAVKRGLCRACYTDTTLRLCYGQDVRRRRLAACKHCGGGPVNRPRGLCWACYYTPGVKDRYPILYSLGPQGRPKGGYYGLGNGNFTGTLPEPTEALPGTPEKIAVLEYRAANGQQLWHPQDAGLSEGMSVAELADALLARGW